MFLYFVAREETVSVDDVLAFLQRERTRRHPDADDRFTFDDRGAHYRNKDTGVEFAFLRTGPAGQGASGRARLPLTRVSLFMRRVFSPDGRVQREAA